MRTIQVWINRATNAMTKQPHCIFNECANTFGFWLFPWECCYSFAGNFFVYNFSGTRPRDAIQHKRVRCRHQSRIKKLIKNKHPFNTQTTSPTSFSKKKIPMSLSTVRESLTGTHVEMSGYEVCNCHSNGFSE